MTLPSEEIRFAMPEGKVILHIEDNFDNRLLVRRLLMASGYQVVEASNAKQARELAGSTLPHLILMDINMPDVDGFTLTHEFKNMANLEKVPIIAITANVMKGDRERTLEAGCDGYIEKPIDVDRFVDQVEGYLK